MTKWLLLVASTCGLIACSSNDFKINTPASSEIRGLATPIQLVGEQTDINLEDYFLDVSKIDSIVANPAFSIEISQDKKILNVNYETAKAPLLSELKVWIKGSSYSLLVKKSKKLLANFTFDPKSKKYKTVQIKGQMNDWNPSKTVLELKDEKYETSMWLNPGIYQYLYVIDGKEILDPENSKSQDNNIGGRNSLLTVGNNVDSLKPYISTLNSSNQIVIGIKNSYNDLLVFWENYRLDDRFIAEDEDKVFIKIPTNACDIKRSSIRIWSFNNYGCSNDVLIPLDFGKIITQVSQLQRTDKQAQILYFLMVDRFNDGNTANNKPVNDPEILPKANYFGGDIAGVTEKLKDGYFDSLGINTIWLSPISQNPLGAWGLNKDPKTKFSGYHGYWPTSLTKVDFRFGTSDELHTLINFAHEKGINVILDYVAHHIHTEHPAWKEHPDRLVQ